MLSAFITANRPELIAKIRGLVASRPAPPSPEDFASGVPVFLDQLVATLRAKAAAAREASEASEASEVERQMNRAAAIRGATLLSHGYTVAQVVHGYGDVCQAVTELAHETTTPILAAEFHTLNLCLDNAIAEAVTEYVKRRELAAAAVHLERSGIFVHELRNKITAAQLAFQAIATGRSPIGGSVAALVTRSLRGLTGLVDQAALEVRLERGNPRRERVSVRAILDDAEVEASLEANVRGLHLSVIQSPRSVDVDVDPQILAGVIANLMHNACKFTPAGGHVSLRASADEFRVRIDVEDQCGGLPPSRADNIFVAFDDQGSDRSGLGLGLFISLKGIEASGGVLRVRDLPGKGCVFTIDLPVLPAAVAKDELLVN